MKRLVVAAAVLVSALVGVAVAASPASAAVSCKTTSTTLSDRPDSGHDGTDWALDHLTRVVQFCEDTPGHYAVTVTDTGSFATQAGQSPNAGTPLAAGITGTATGGYTESFTAAAGFADYTGAFDGKSYTGSDPSSTGDFAAKDFGGAVTGDSGLIGWSWTYISCSESWTDADPSAGGGPADGDITGKACPSPSPSPSVAPTRPAAPVAGSSPTHGATHAAGNPQPVQAGPVPAVVTSESPSAEATPTESPSTTPSASSSSAEATVSPAANAPATVATSSNSNLPWYISVIGVVLVGGGALGLATHRRKHKFPQDYPTVVQARHVDDGPKS